MLQGRMTPLNLKVPWSYLKYVQTGTKPPCQTRINKEDARGQIRKWPHTLDPGISARVRAAVPGYTKMLVPESGRIVRGAVSEQAPG